MSTEVLVAVTALLALCYVAAGMLVAARVADHAGMDSWPFKVVVTLLWPAVAAGVEILWLLGVNDWHLR